jgi:hypothetical protein
MTITDFLLARIAEDEAEAQAWLKPSVATVTPWSIAAHYLAGSINDRPMPSWSHDPARVLAECAAKRHIVDRVREQAGYIFDEPDEEWSEAVHVSADVLRALASAYSDHPDYRDAWA